MRGEQARLQIRFARDDVFDAPRRISVSMNASVGAEVTRLKLKNPSRRNLNRNRNEMSREGREGGEGKLKILMLNKAIKQLVPTARYAATNKINATAPTTNRKINQACVLENPNCRSNG